MDNIPLINGQRLATTKVTSDGVAIHTPHYRQVDGVAPTAVVIAPLRLDGAPAGAVAMDVDGSSAPAVFSYPAPAGRVVTLRALSLVLESDGAAVAGGFGSLEYLENGIGVEVMAADGITVLANLTGGLDIHGHTDLIALGADVRFLDTATGVDLTGVRWAFPAPLELQPGQSIRLTIADDLTGLAGMRAFVSGESRAA